MFALANGVQGRSPCKKNGVILRRRPQTAMPPKNLVPTELFLGRRGTGTMKSAEHNRIHCGRVLCMHFLYKAELYILIRYCN